jgi:hypothetical protein
MVAINSNNIDPDDLPPPTPEIIEWCTELVRVIKDGGVWGIPRSGTTFRVDQKNKRLICIRLGFSDDSDFLATKHNFAFIGWDVVMEHEDEKQNE